MPSRPLFVSWTPAHGRSAALAAAIGAQECYPVGRILRPWSAPLRYLVAGWRTWSLIRTRRPSAVLVMVPPPPAAVVGWLAARRLGVPVVLDVHTGAINHRKWAWAWPVVRWVARRSRLTLVTTAALAAVLRGEGVPSVLALHDPPVTVPVVRAESVGGMPTVVVVAGWDADEPVDALLGAAGLLAGIRVVATGRAPDGVRARAAGAVEFTGWLPDAEYWALLAPADVVVALTTKEFTMQRGGYEALAVHRPLVTSDTAVLREFFGPAAVYADATAESIAAAVGCALEGGAEMSTAMAVLDARRRAAWPAELAALRAALGEG